jgi:N-acetylglucosamine-6-sulfatase
MPCSRILAVATRSGHGSRSRRVILGVLACLATFLAFGCSGSGPAQKEEAEAPTIRPNIILVLVDDLDYASALRMPAISSSLLEEGASFENAFASYPLCCPSRATILTGLYAHNHEVKGNRPPNGGFEKFRDEGHEEDTIAALLQQSGYRTALFGKYLNGYGEEDPTYVPSGWDEWHVKLDKQRAYDYRTNENGEVVSHGREAEDFYTDFLSNQATEYVRSAAPNPEPFFLHLTPTAPHLPATPAERHEDAFAGEEAPHPPSFDEEDLSDKPSWISNIDRVSDEEASEIDERYQKRLKSMLAVDEMVAALVEELEAAGELDDTFLFFTSDNGFLQGEHRVMQGKSRAYEESSRVPLFVRGPGVTAGWEIKEIVLNTDLASTFAELAGLEEFPAADGRSLAPLIRGEELPSWRNAVLLEAEGFGEEEASSPPAFRAVRTETHKYVEYENGERELYDLTTDPYELENLHKGADFSLVGDLKAKLDALRSCVSDECREAEDAQ